MRNIPNKKNKIIAIIICIVMLLGNISIYAEGIPNIALGKKIYSLGDKDWWDATKANDGIENKSDSTDTWLSKVQYSALYIDLEAFYDISKIELVFPSKLPNTNSEYLTLGTTECKVQSVDGLTGTPNGSKLLIDEADRSDILERGSSYTYWSGTVSKTNTTDNTLTINHNNLKTRYLRIMVSNSGTNAVNIACLTELKIFGTLSINSNQKPNIAAGKSVYSINDVNSPNIATGKKIYSLGNSYWGANLAIDGLQTSNNSSDTWLAQMQYSAIYIDLGNEYNISRMELVFPGWLPNTNGEYLTLGKTEGYVDTVESLPGTPNGTVLEIEEKDRSNILENEYKENVYSNNNITKSNTTDNTLIINPATFKARYLRVRIYNNGAINLSSLTELKIYGYMNLLDRVSLASKANDGNKGNWYSENDTWMSYDKDSIIYIDLGVKFNISKIELSFPTNSKEFKDGYLGHQITQCYVQSVQALPSENITGGIIYVDDLKRTDIFNNGFDKNIFSGQIGYSNTQANVKTIDNITNTTTRYLRVRVANTQQVAALSEINVYGDVYVDQDKSVLLKTISANGTALSNFDVAKNEFDYMLPINATKCPVITAIPFVDGAKISVKQGDMTTKKAVITVTSRDGSVTAVYNLNFLSQILVSREKYALSYVNAYESANNAIDGKVDTKWKAFSNWGCMFIDLGMYYDLTNFSINFGDNANGVWSYKIDSMTLMPAKGIEGSSGDVRAYLDETYVEKNLFMGTCATNNASIVSINGKARYIRLLISDNTKYKEKEAYCTVDEFEVFATEPQYDSRIKSINVGGASLDGFSSNRLGYFFEVSKNVVKPIAITAQPMVSGATVTIKQATKIPGQAEITCVSKDKTQTSKYIVYFVYGGKGSEVLTNEKKPIAYKNPENSVPGFAFDGNYDTVWDSGSKTTALFIDLKGPYHISRAQLNFAQGSSENYNIKIDRLSSLPEYNRNTTENLGESLVTQCIYDGSSKSLNGNDVLLEVDSSARYVRLLVSDSTVNVGIREFTLYGYSESTSKTSLKAIKVDGKVLTEFDDDYISYFYPLPTGTQAAPVVTAEPTDVNSTVKIIQAQNANDAAKILVTSSGSTRNITYYVYFREMISAQEKIISQGKSVSATSTLAGSNPSYLTDGNLTTLWKSQDKGFYPTVTVDLGRKYYVTAMNSIIRELTNRDVVSYAVDISSDGVHFVRAYNSDSDIYKAGNLLAAINKVARYLKVTYFGIHGYKYAPLNISELMVYGTEAEELVSSIKANGVVLTEFIENVTEYTYSFNASSGAIPQFSAVAAGGATVEVVQAKNMNGNVIINVQKGQTKIQYTIMLCPSKISLIGKQYYLQYKDYTINEK